MSRNISYRAIGLLAVAIAIFAYFKFRKPKVIAKKAKPKETEPSPKPAKAPTPTNTQLVFDPSEHANINSLRPIERAMFGEVHDHLFEVEKWQKLMPKQSFHPDWRVEMEPASRNTPIRFKVWNQANQAAVKVIFDPYSIHTNLTDPHWQVSAQGKKAIQVPMQDTQLLRASIANYLQQISPVRHDEEE